MSRRHPPERVDMVVGADGAPAAFRWRGRGYVVRSVLANWVEAMPWWSGGIPPLPAGGQSGLQGHLQSQLWRVEAVGSTGVGVYDLRRSVHRMHASAPSWSADRGDVIDVLWRVERVLD